MKLKYIGALAALLLVELTTLAAAPATVAYAANAVEPQMVSTAGYDPATSETKLYTELSGIEGMSGSPRHDKLDYTPPVDIFGKTPYGPFSHLALTSAPARSEAALSWRRRWATGSTSA